ncbi:MAG: hypothetical protein JRC93_11110 [Deltaproteobacteria bacterium]|nr:hypothetical protein [Deltaproteobacteria bacterium]
MYWFGWIPILTHRLLIRPALEKLFEKSISFDDLDDERFVGNQCYMGSFTADVRAAIKNTLEPALDTSVFYYVKNFDDTDSNIFQRVAVSVDSDGYVKRIGLFGYPDPDVVAVAQILEIEKTGLTKFRLEQHVECSAHMKDVFIKHLFGEIRDIYHEHIYAPHGDFPLRPVKSSGGEKQDAIDEIFWQYQIKILDYHSIIRTAINKVEELSLASTSVRFFHDITINLCSATGEMSYALSFVNLFQKSQEEESSIKNAIISFENLTRHLEFVSGLKSISTNLMALSLTFIATALAVSQITSNLDPIPRWSITLISAASMTIGLRLIAALKTKRPKK